MIIINDNNLLSYNFKEVFDFIYQTTLNKLELEKKYDLSVSFVTNKEIQEINHQYRNIDKATDVLSFAMLDDIEIEFFVEDSIDLGDIFISVEMAKSQSIDLKQSLEREICFLFTHGLLHLLGYDHQSSEDEKVMFSLQREIINEVYQSGNFKI